TEDVGKDESSTAYRSVAAVTAGATHGTAALEISAVWPANKKGKSKRRNHVSDCGFFHARLEAGRKAECSSGHLPELRTGLACGRLPGRGFLGRCCLCSRCLGRGCFLSGYFFGSWDCLHGNR